MGVRPRRPRLDLRATGTGRSRAPGAPIPWLRWPCARPIAEHPANTVRSITRLFTSDVEDKPWFNDREMWPPYLIHAGRAAVQSLQPGASASATTSCSDVTDAYFLFAYPFLLAVPGLQRARAATAGRRARSQPRDAALHRAAKPSRAAWSSSWASGCTATSGSTARRPNYTIEGLTTETHGALLPRRAARRCCRPCPEISGVTFRIHGESGVDRGQLRFLEDGVRRRGDVRPQGRDRHARQGNGPGHDRHGARRPACR